MNHLINDILLLILRYRDGSAQLEEYSDRNLDWIDYKVKPRDLGQRLAQKLAIDLELDPL